MTSRSHAYFLSLFHCRLIINYFYILLCPNPNPRVSPITNRTITSYVDNNIKEIQQLYISEELPKRETGKVEEEEVILIKPYKVLESISTKSSSFINEEIDNLIKYMKFVKVST